MGELRDELERRALEIGLMRRVGQVDTEEMMQLLREVLEHGEVAHEPVWRLLEEHLLTEAEYEHLLGPIPRLPSRGMGHGAEPPLLPPTGRHAAKRRGS